MGLFALQNGALVAQQASRSGKSLVEQVTVEQLANFLRGEGYSVESTAENKVVWKLEGSRCRLFVSSEGKSIQFYTVLTGSNANMRKVNDWNKSKRYSRCYLDDDGDPVLELDLDLEGGVTVDRLRDFLRTCRTSFPVWVKELVQ
jgi:hypothetical protein